MLVNSYKSSSWDDFLEKNILQELLAIENQIGDNYTPQYENILRFMNNDLDHMKVCIIGQDPYHSINEGKLVANGRAFQPSDLMSWSQSFRQVSLKNIIRLIHKSYNDIDEYNQIKKFKEIVYLIETGEFLLKQPIEWFDSLEKQGVLFLNRYLTTEIKKANAHRKIWDQFMKKTITYIDQSNPDMIWFLWGKEANECQKLIINGKIISSRHPMMCSDKYKDDFLKAKCFEETKNIINWLG